MANRQTANDFGTGCVVSGGAIAVLAVNRGLNLGGGVRAGLAGSLSTLRRAPHLSLYLQFASRVDTMPVQPISGPMMKSLGGSFLHADSHPGRFETVF